MKKDIVGYNVFVGCKINFWFLKGVKKKKGFLYFRDMLCRLEV